MINLENIKLIDLTHSLTSQIPNWDANCGFQQHVTLDYDDCSTEVKFRVQKFETPAGIGTHMDAPAHCIPKGKTIDKISLEQLVRPCIVIDVSSKADEYYSVSTDDILVFENKHGKITENTFVIIYTGWEKLWTQPQKYRNNLVFPSVSKEAAELLLDRNIAGLGIDTLSPDIPSSGFPVHQLILGSGKYIIENIVNANQLPPVDAVIVALPIKVLEGTEAPIRLVAIVDK